MTLIELERPIAGAAKEREMRLREIGARRLAIIGVGNSLVDGDGKLMANTENPKIRTTLSHIVTDSRRHAEMPRSVAETFRKIMLDEEKHARLVQQLAEEAHKE
jgi:hypothetical protein